MSSKDHSRLRAKVVQFPNGTVAQQYRDGSDAWFTTGGSTISTEQIPAGSLELGPIRAWPLTRDRTGDVVDLASRTAASPKPRRTP